MSELWSVLQGDRDKRKEVTLLSGFTLRSGKTVHVSHLHEGT